MWHRIVVGVSAGLLVIVYGASVAPAALGQDDLILPPADQPPLGIQTPLLDPSAQQQRELLARALLDLVPGQPAADTELGRSFQRAVDLFLEEQIDEMIERLRAMREDNPELPPATLLVGAAMFGVGAAGDAVNMLELTAREHPGYPSTYFAFARIAINQNRLADAWALLHYAERQIDQGQWSDSQRRHFRIELLDGITDVTWRRGKFEEAKETLEKLSELVSDNYRVPLRLGEIEFQLGNLDAAVEQLKLAAELEPDLQVPEAILSNWFLRQDNLESSREWIERASSRYPQEPRVQLEYARWLVHSGNLTRASMVLQEVESDPTLRNAARFLKGQIAFARQAYSVAETHFDELHRSQPGNMDIANLLALSLIESADQAKQAKATQLAAINAQLNPNNPNALGSLGWILYRQGERAQAEAVLGRAASGQVISAEVAYYLAHLLADRGNTDEARELVQRALEHPGFFLYRTRAEELRERLGEAPASAAGDDAGGVDRNNDR